MPTLYARGTGGYRAPEILNENPMFTNKVDIWALGCIFFDLYTGKTPFNDDWSVREYHSKSEDLTLPGPNVANVDLAIRSLRLGPLSRHDDALLSQLLARDPTTRPRVANLCLFFEAQCLLTSAVVAIQERSIPPREVPFDREMFSLADQSEEPKRPIIRFGNAYRRRSEYGMQDYYIRVVGFRLPSQ